MCSRQSHQLVALGHRLVQEGTLASARLTWLNGCVELADAAGWVEGLLLRRPVEGLLLLVAWAGLPCGSKLRLLSLEPRRARAERRCRVRGWRSDRGGAPQVPSTAASLVLLLCQPKRLLLLHIRLASSLHDSMLLLYLLKLE